MKQKNIDQRRRVRRHSALVGVGLFGLLQIASAVCFGSLCLIPGLPGWTEILFGVLAGLCLLMIVPALIVLKQRFIEIEGGELDEAAEY